MKQISLLIFMLYVSTSFCQREVIAIANGKDTISVEQFDASNNLVFEKTYPIFYGIALIRAFVYDDNNRKTRFIWLHSNAGFSVTDYEYDSLQNIKKEFKYKSTGNFKNGISLISEINSMKDLEKEAKLKEAIEQGRYLSEISYFKDTLLTTTICFDKNGDTSNIINYSYNDQNLLILKHDTSTNGFSCRLFYTYDTIGRMLSWGKCDLDNPSILFRYDYETPNIIKRYEVDNGQIVSTEIEEYKDDIIVKRKFYKKSNDKEAYRVISYEYDDEFRLIREYNTNHYYNSKPWETIYIYK